jgi:hypothetical protein
VKTDRGIPELEIELRPIAPSTGGGNHHSAPQPASARDPRRRWTIAGLVAVAAIVIVTLSVIGGNDSGPDTVAPAPSPTSTSALQPATIQISAPNILGAAPSSLLLWSFDDKFRLQVLNLDSGELRPLGAHGGFALFPLFRDVVVFDGDNGSSVVTANGATTTEQLGKGTYPVVEREGRTFWVLANDAPRQWQKRALDGTVLDVLPFDARYGVVHYTDHAVLLTSAEGTSLFDLITRQREFLTPAHVVAAGGPNLLARNCVEQRCTLTLIDIATRLERAVVVDVAVDDANTATLSPDGAFIAMNRTSPEFGRQATIISVVTGAAQWQSPAGASSSSPSWSWSPDSRWFFTTTTDAKVLGVDMRAPWVRLEIPLSLAPVNGLAVTYR